jgi:hypothetical protein
MDFDYRGKKRSSCCGILDYLSHMSSIATGGLKFPAALPLRSFKAVIARA